jgi:hypothetical protein
MLNKREKLLLTILGWVFAACLFLILVIIRSAQMGEARKHIADYEQELRRFELIQPNKEELKNYFDDLTKEIKREEVRFYKPGEEDLTQFGKKLHSMLASYHLVFSRFQNTNDKGNRFIEISVTGSAWNFSRFLKEVFQYPKYWSISYITLTNRHNKTISATFRINYEELEK